jgi:hypothetical protein
MEMRFQHVNRLRVQMVIPEEEGPWFSVWLIFFSIMHPRCAVRTRWDLYILIVMMVLCFITPYTIGFDVTASEHGALGVITDFLHTLSLHAFHCLVAFLWSLNCGEALQQLAVALML